MRVRSDGPQLISQMVQKYLNIDCSVLMGANIAGDIGREELSEAVIGYTNFDHAKLLQKIFKTKAQIQKTLRLFVLDSPLSPIMSTLEDLDDIERENKDGGDDKDKDEKPSEGGDAQMKDAGDEQKPEEEEDLLDSEILHSSTRDIDNRRKLLESEMRILKSEFNRLTHEKNAMSEKIKDNLEKIENNK